jgi:hypothetical protein
MEKKLMNEREPHGIISQPLNGDVTILRAPFPFFLVDSDRKVSIENAQGVFALVQEPER